mgnify:CR=1 FL=1
MSLLKSIPKVDKFITNKAFEGLSKTLVTKITKEVIENLRINILNEQIPVINEKELVNETLKKYEDLINPSLKNLINATGIIVHTNLGRSLLDKNSIEKAINIARDAGLGITLHAGEADAGHQVIEAARLGATRIGHGVNVVRQEADGSPRWTDQAKALGLHFEVCPSSNVHTGAATSIAAHPIRAMLDAGLSLSCSTDNRLMSDTTLCKELELIHQQANVSLQEIIAMQYAGIEASFLPEDVKAAAKAKVQAWEKAQA